ncbi:MAG: cation transporter [Oscillospiraceae bacterium]|nr:cation transporter [Oscillospiraceae bacterium]
MQTSKLSKTELFEHVSIPRALAIMGIPTIISQLINLIYNMVDAFFIGRTGNSYMVGATTVTLTLTLLNVAFANLFGVGGGSLIARLMGQKRTEAGRQVSAYAVRGAILIGLSYSLLVGLCMNPLLRLLGASDATVDFARQYTLYVIVIGSTPTVLALTLSHLLRNTGYSARASFGLSMGGVLNMLLDPLFMFVILPRGQEVQGAALATLISNVFSCGYLLLAFHRASATAPLTLRLGLARGIERENRRALYAVGVPSAVLTGLFDVASVCVNVLAAAHDDLVLAAFGIVMKVERIPNAVNIGICQGMMPIVAYNYAAGNRLRMRAAVRTARYYGLLVSGISILLLELFARPVTNLFLSTSSEGAGEALKTVVLATSCLRVRCLAAPAQLVNYHASFSLQAIGNGRYTMLHACVRELGIYIPLMFLLDGLFGEIGLASALPAGEGLAAIFALWLLRRALKHD